MRSITHSVSQRVGAVVTMKDIRDLAESLEIPDNATVKITYSSGDQRDMTPGSNTISVTWSTDPARKTPYYGSDGVGPYGIGGRPGD